MKKIYILKQGNVILAVSFNIKAIYDFLSVSMPSADKINLKGYVQFWRDFKTKKKVTIPCQYSEYFEVLYMFPIKNVKAIAA